MRQNKVFVSTPDCPKCSFQVTLEAGRGSEAEHKPANERTASSIKARDFMPYAAERPTSNTAELRHLKTKDSMVKLNAPSAVVCKELLGGWLITQRLKITTPQKW